jgi:hypothetical protein
MLIMKRLAITIAAAALICLAAQPAHADDADNDTTPVTQCDGLPPSVSIMVVTWRATAQICREMIRTLEGVRYKDITIFEKAIYLLRRQGHYDKDDVQIAKELVEIIRLRGLYDKPDRWFGTNDLIYRSVIAFNGAVGPDQVIAFLRSSGPDMAKSLSDDGLMKMIIVIKRMHQSGD